jgi:hypothetical protein
MRDEEGYGRGFNGQSKQKKWLGREIIIQHRSGNIAQEE